MKVIGQPESYSDMLLRISLSTFGVALACTYALARGVPRIKALLDALDLEVQGIPIVGIKLLYIAVPLVIALLARVFRLHDKISDAIGLRYRFERDYIIHPMMERLRIEPTDDFDRLLSDREARGAVMQKVFYRYAGFKTPVIDEQLIRSALDEWAWLWCAAEAIFLLLIAAVVQGIAGSSGMAVAMGAVICALLFIAWSKYQTCVQTAQAQERAIFDDAGRATVIKQAFLEIESTTVQLTKR